MKTYSVDDTSSFDGVIVIVNRAYTLLKTQQPNLKGEALREAYSRLLVDIYNKYQHFKSFQVFDSFIEFKSKIGTYFNKNKTQKQRNKQKAPPSGIRNWEAFWEFW